MVSKSYSEMIEEAVLHLGEVMGSSRQSIWKALSAQYADADYKQFVIRLKKMREAGQIAQKKGMFRLEINYKHKLLKALENGKSGVANFNKSAATIKKKAGTKKGGKSSSA